jgi:hypothetical protein
MKGISKHLGLTFLALATFAPSLRLEAAVRCFQGQAQCVTAARDTTIGDRVGFFNHEDELVAVGTVRRMQGGQRLVLISEATGTISSNARVERLDESTRDTPSLTKVYRPRMKQEAGLFVGSVNMKIGLGGGGTAYDLSWAKTLWRDLKIGVHGMYLESSGVLTNKGSSLNASYGVGASPYGVYTNGALGTSTRERYSMETYALMPALHLTLWREEALSLRAEAAAGIARMDARLNDDTALLAYSSVDSGLTNGFVVATRAKASVMANFQRFHPELGGSWINVHEASGYMIHAGVVVEID